MAEKKDFKYLIYLLFILSGVSGLIYQIVWTRMLVLVFGNTMLATATVLSAFMGGLAAGSYFLGKYIDKTPRPLLTVYGILEVGIGLFALLFPLFLDLFTPVYELLYHTFEGNIILLNLSRFAVCFVLIGIPTFLMGGTLPVLIKKFTSENDKIGSQTGFLYGMNTVGAVVGTLACGYFLLRILGMYNTTMVAVVINIGVGVVAWFLGKNPIVRADDMRLKEVKTNDTFEDEKKYGKGTIRLVLVGIFLSGYCALAYEVFWTRMLNLFLHNNIYSFTAILATFLVGIAVGSLLYAKYLIKIKQQVALFAFLQIGIAAISYLTPFIFKMLHASLFNNFNEALTLAKTSVIMIGPTIMMGVAVPLAIQICRRGVNKEGTSVGTVYSSNTVGAILGAFTAGFIILPTVGLHLGIIIVASLNMLAGFLPLISTAKSPGRIGWAAGLVLVIVVMVVPTPDNLFKSLFQQAHPNADIAYYKEGRIANVLVYDFKKLGYKDFHLNAVNEASSRIWHVQLFKMLGLLPTLVHDNPDDALMVAFGAGMSAGATARNVNSLDVVDLNPDIQGVGKAYTRENLDVLNQPNFNQIVNDGRNELLLNSKKYSLIISDATNPKMFDSWTLYSQEFYQLVKSRLKPGGVFCQWALIPLPKDAIKVILNTFKSVFPHASFWVIHGSSQVMMLGTPERLEIDYYDLQKRLEPLYDDADFKDFGIDSPEKFLSFFVLGEDALDKMLTGFDKVSTDDLPHAQFHIEQGVEGVDNCMDIVRYQESIVNYMKNPENLPEGFVEKMNAYDDINRRMNVAFLTTNNVWYSEAAVIADNAGMKDANVDHHLNHCMEKKRYFRERLKEHPEDYTAHNWLGNIMMLDGEHAEAKVQFQKALEIKPDYAFAIMNLGTVEMYLKNNDAATSMFLKAKKIAPSKRILTAVDRQLQKISLYRKLDYTPDDITLIRGLARQFYNEGMILEAVKLFRRAIQIDSTDTQPIIDLATICENHGYVQEASELYLKLAQLQPESSQILARQKLFASLASDDNLYRNWRNDRYGHPADANAIDPHPIKECDEALAIWREVDLEDAADFGRLKKAADLYEKATHIDKNDLHAYIDAATLYEAIGLYEDAAKLYKNLYDKDSSKVHYQLNQQRLRAMAKLKDENLTSEEKSKLLKQIGRGYFNTVSKSIEGLEYLKQALLLTPHDEALLTQLAEMSVYIGDYADARSYAEQLKTVNPDNPHVDQLLNMMRN
ncbi:MAG: hypothetical protein DWP97_05475 [Calditrichaeota bacterium]|nr:MAG: hypothetical protein DWP97_05475 [Calditrichota bacterium]